MIVQQIAQAQVPVGLTVDVMSGCAQVSRQGFGEILIVLDNKNPRHCTSILSGNARQSPARVPAKPARAKQHMSKRPPYAKGIPEGSSKMDHPRKSICELKGFR